LTSIRGGLTLFRNLLCIPDPQVTDEASAEAVLKASMQVNRIKEFFLLIFKERLIRQLSEQHLLDLFISLASSMDERANADWNLIILEIFYHVFNPYHPSDLLAMPDKDENVRKNNGRSFKM
jgi:hypothetical protein